MEEEPEDGAGNFPTPPPSTITVFGGNTLGMADLPMR